MPLYHRGAQPRGNCQGKRLDGTHDELACHAQGEKRNDIIRLLNCWINTYEIENPTQKEPEPPCSGSLLCYPEFKCDESVPLSRKKPRCVRGDTPVSLIPETVCYKAKPLWKMDDPPPPFWERPRVKSSQLIGGDWIKVKECFRANGLNDFDYCPRTESCQVMRCMNELIEADRRIHGPEAMSPDCCCRPGDAPSRMQQYKCNSCEPPSKFGHKNIAQMCPAEVGRRQEHYKSHYHDDSCPRSHHQGDMNPYRMDKTTNTHRSNSYKQANMGQNRIQNCLTMDNPRASGEMWKVDTNPFGH